MDLGSLPLPLRTFFSDPNARFPKKPRLIDDLNIIQAPSGLGFQFRGGPIPVAIRGEKSVDALEYLLAAMDGSATVDEVVEGRPESIQLHSLMKTLFLLHTKGLLTEGDTEITKTLTSPIREFHQDTAVQRQLLYWGRNLGQTGYLGSAEEIQYRLESANIVLVGTGLFGISTFDILARSGLTQITVIDWDDTGFMLKTLSDSPFRPIASRHTETTSVGVVTSLLRDFVEHADLVITSTRGAPRALFEAINRTCLDMACPFILANDDGSIVELGPYVVPYGSACFNCKELRHASASDFVIDEHIYEMQQADERPSGVTPPLGEAIATALLGANILALECLRVLTGIAVPTLENRVVTISPLDGDITYNQVMRVPRCPECSRGAIAVTP